MDDAVPVACVTCEAPPVPPVGDLEFAMGFVEFGINLIEWIGALTSSAKNFVSAASAPDGCCSSALGRIGAQA